jgi:hypothetical protein
MSRNSNNGRSSNNTGRTELVSRERFLRAVQDIYRERERNAELQAALQRAYTDGAAAVLNSDVFTAYVPTRERRGLRAWNFGRTARRAAARRNSTED